MRTINEIAEVKFQLPESIADLATWDKFLSARLPTYRKLLHSVKSWEEATEEEKRILRRAQEEAENLIDVRVRIGELYKNIPEEKTGRPEKNECNVAPTYTEKQQFKQQTGLSDDQAKRYQKLANHPEAVQKAKEDARKRNDVVSQQDVTNVIKEQKRIQKETKQEEQRQENAEKIESLSSPLDAQGLFQTIVIDPPWDWGDEGDVNQFGRAKPDYHTMPIEEIEKMPISKIADTNCHLYLWVTNRSLPKAFRLIEAWGFRYITCITWVKPSIGMGNYFRGSTEQVLFAVKGSQPLKRKDVGTHFEAPRGNKHSAKPDEFYSLIESCSYAPYIDIFGRKERTGWSVWGEDS